MLPSDYGSDYSINSSVINFLSSVNDGDIVFVSFSGGLDSTVLLHAINENLIKLSLSTKLVAIYVDHGLQSDSKIWAKDCEQFCKEFSIDFVGLQIKVDSTARKGVEAVARALRYQAILDYIDSYSVESKHCVYLLTGHHRKDQAETFLLNLFRGAGVNGLSSMPISRKLMTNNAIEVIHSRPILDVPYSDIEQYAATNNLRYVTDKTNFETIYKRNIVRHKVLPELEKVWPHAETTLIRAAQNMQEAAVLLDLYAEQELKSYSHNTHYLTIKPFIEESWIKQKNIIRFWLKSYSPQIILSHSHYQWIEDAIKQFDESQNHGFRYELPGGSLRIYKNKLYFLEKNPQKYCYYFDSFAQIINTVKSNDDFFYSFTFNKLYSPLNISVRNIEKADNLKRKKLKLFFQKNNIPIWERLVWPVLEVNGELVAVLGCPNCIAKNEDAASGINKQTTINISEEQCMQWMGII
ncbi:tRNA lysidine(34) synthetase TilS [Thiomicrorhabdus sp.]|uniref:tRNA lysidine(34) synthetase TilS n=1 Tax=Thiomicrorhabdus sp. TaxID=2039724 RepID=UPI002AA64EBD|nr:tRNA lysidine(34) synthetase TilS [Thiomicrorhabdus sp.]